MISSTRKTSLGFAVSLALILSLGACVPPKYIEASVSVWCDTNKPTRPTREQYAAFSETQKIDMADHNEFGAKHCGWKP